MNWGHVSRPSASGRLECTNLVVLPRGCSASSLSVPDFAIRWIPQGKSGKGLSPNGGLLGPWTVSLGRAQGCSGMGLEANPYHPSLLRLYLPQGGAQRPRGQGGQLRLLLNG